MFIIRPTAGVANESYIRDVKPISNVSAKMVPITRRTTALILSIRGLLRAKKYLSGYSQAGITMSVRLAGGKL
jgi:hypothetical protein